MDAAVPIVDRVSLIQERFNKPQLRPVPFSTTAVYWISIVLLFQTAWYCYRMLDNPCSTFHLLDTKMPLLPRLVPWNPFSPRLPSVPTCLKTSDTSSRMIRKLICLFPKTIPGFMIRLFALDYDEFYPTCSSLQQRQGPGSIHLSSSLSAIGWWITLPFVVKVLVAYVAFVHELFLLPGGRTDPTSKTWVFNHYRHSLLGWTTASSFFVAIAFTIPPSDPILLWVLSHVSCFAFVGLSAALFFRRIQLIRFALATIHAVKIVIVLSRGAVVGGFDVTFLLLAEGVLEICAVLVSEDVVADPLSSAVYNLWTTLSTLFLYAATVLVGTVHPTFPEDYGRVLFPADNFGTVVVSCIASGLLGLVSVLLISPKTYQAFRTTCSVGLWSFLQLLLMSASFVKNPYKLSDVYDRDHPPVCLTMKPFWQQHPRYMPKRLDIPCIASDILPRTVEIFSDLKTALNDGFRLLCWLDYHFPHADPLAPLKNKVRMRPWDDGSRFFPSFLFQLSPTFPKEAKTLPETPQPMIDAFKEGSVLAYLCQYGVGNTFLRRAREIDAYPFFELIQEWDAPREQNEGVVLDFTHLEPYETKPDYEAYGGVAYFEFEMVYGINHLVVRWVVTPRTERKTRFNKYSGDFRRAEEMIVSSLYFETAVGKHLGELHMTYNVLATIMNNAFDFNMNADFPNAPYNAHPFRLILYPHLYSHNIVVELTVNHLVQVGGSFTQVFALTQESLCDYLTTNYNLFHYAVDEQFEQRAVVNEPLLSWPPVQGQPRRTRTFNCSLDWEMDYAAIFHTYALEMTNAVYVDDDQVRRDAALQSFFHSLREFIHRVPSRYDEFQTKNGVARFLSDTIFHLTVKHEFYGNTGFFAAVDPRINATQVPKDGGPPAVDEWLSLAYIFIGTAYPNFICLLQDPENPNRTTYERELVSIFDDVTPVYRSRARLDEGPIDDYTILRNRMQKAFWNMQHSLRELHDKWRYRGNGKRSEADESYMYFRPLPAELPTGPGY